MAMNKSKLIIGDVECRVDWSQGKRYRRRPVIQLAMEFDHPFGVQTPEGFMCGQVGDYLVRGLAGEIYPVSAEVFHKLYEEVTDDE